MRSRYLVPFVMAVMLVGFNGHGALSPRAALARAADPQPSALTSFGEATTQPLCGGAPAPAPWTAPAAGAAQAGQMPPPLASFDGINRAEANPEANPNSVDDSGATDTSGAVGPQHYVQTINEDIGIFDKAGNRLCGPVTTTSFFNQLTGCGRGYTDAIVLYDHFANRWLISRFAGQQNPAPGFWNQCVAISTSPDPTGTYNLYGFHLWSNTNRGPNYFGDYPKFGITPDAYFMEAGARDLDTRAVTGSKFAVAFNRAQMLAGQASAAQVEFFVPAAKQGADSHMMPADVDGATAPPAGSPEYFIETRDQSEGFASDEVDVWAFQLDWRSAASATFSQAASLPAQDFNSNYCNCVPQPGTSKPLESHAGLLMFRTAYRNVGDHESIVLNEGVAVGDTRTHGGILWFELQHRGGAWSISQQQTYAPDENTRWLGSIAMDKSGNIGLAYNVSGSNVYPGIRYAGRLANDPPNTLPQSEATLIAGAGSDLGGGNGIGDYAELTLDPTDDCTFWYTSAYIATTTQGGDYHTRIGAFRFSSCGGTPQPASNPNAVSYAAGWNLVAGTDGTTLSGASGSLYTLQPGDSNYQTLAPGAPLKGGQGYWVYFSAATTQTLAGGGSASVTIDVPAGQYVMLGNPSLRPATVSGADLVYVFDPNANGYVATTTLQPGQGAWVLTLARRRVTIAAH